MAGADDAAGVHPDIGGIFERDHGDAHSNSRTGSDYAEPRREERFGGEPDAAVARTGAAGGGPDLQRPTAQRGGAAVPAVGTPDESVAAGARGGQPWTMAPAHSA